MAEPLMPNTQYQGQPSYIPLTPDQNNPQFQASQPYMPPQNQTNPNYVGVPQVNNPQNYEMNPNSPYMAPGYDNGEITRKRLNCQICISVFFSIILIINGFAILIIYSDRSARLQMDFLSLIGYIQIILMIILVISMIVNSCQRKTSRTIVNGILSLFIAIIHGFGIALTIVNGTFSNIFTIVYLIFYIYLTLFNYKGKGCTVGDN